MATLLRTAPPPLPEPSAAARAFLDGRHRLLIGGEWVEGQGRTIAVENPARGEIIAEVRAASLTQLDAAVSAARSARHGDWGRMSGRDRGIILLRMADLLDARADLIGEVMTLDNGSPLVSSTMVVRHLAAELFRYYGGWATKIAGESFQPSLTARPGLDFLVATVREPVGVVGAIVPWNAPPGMIALKMAPALAAGCTMVLKTAELAPLVGELMAAAWTDAGGPPGAFNLVHGHGEDVGAALAAHAHVDKIAFTGSTAVGRKIVEAATDNLKKVSLELGGKSPVIVFPDADMDAVIPAAAMACYLSTGQQCMAGSRLFLHADIHDRVAEGVAAYARTLTVGDGLVPGTVLGPLISARQKARVLDYLDIARAEGATPLLESDAIDGPGHFVGPALFTGVTPGMRIEQEEVFGPVIAALRFDDEDALLEAVNGTPYGLSGSVWTRDIARALRVAKRVDSGQVAINAHAAMSAETPFGGNRQSGWGREFGREGLDGYLKTKAISINLGPSREREPPAVTAKIVVVGAGLGGLTAALALRCAGFAVEVHEAAPQLGEVGAGLTLSRGAQSVFRRLGVQNRVAAVATPSTGFPFLHYRTGALLAGRLDHGVGLPDDGTADVSRQCHRADLHAVLAAAYGGPLHLGRTLAGIDETAHGVVARFADGSTATGDALIAADGVRSVARGLLGNDDAPRFTGQVAYRFLVDRAEALPFLEHGRGAVFVGPRRTFNRYTLRSGSIVNAVGIAATDDWAGEGWSTPAAIAEVQAAFADFHPAVTGLIGRAGQLIKWGIFDRAPLPRWSHGRVTLLGDAAHAMLPFLGMGAAMAIEDGMILARAFAAETAVDAAFARYEAARRPRTALLHAKSVEQGELTQARDPDHYDHAAAPAADPAISGYDPVSAAI